MHKKLIISLLAIYALCETIVTFAATGEVVGQISKIRSHDVTLGSNLDWISLSGIMSAGSCQVAGGLGVLFMFKDDERGRKQFSIALAAKAAGKQITVGYDDVALRNTSNDNYCYVRYIEML
ncbi:MAG: hypothetical protein AABZ84_01525 [Pseudomonadota bacterium]